mgnify:CR=1 FL=1
MSRDVLRLIQIYEGDIIGLTVDAIVNAANSQLAGGGGVDGAIHRAAGPDLLKACSQFNGCSTGDVKVTPGFLLPAKYIFHAVGPIWQGGCKGEPDLLASCYQRSMTLAAELEISSIAFPAISCGVYGYPVDQAVDIAINEVSLWLGQSKYLQKVIFVCFGSDMHGKYQAALNRISSNQA